MEHVNFPEMYRWLLVAGLLLAILALIIIPVKAAPYLMQGDTVCLEQTVDISGVLGGYTGAAYYGLSGDTESDPSYVYDLPESKKGWYSFYIDPAIFRTRLGPWYKFTGNNTGVEHGNLLAFYVKSKEACQIQNVTTDITPVPTPTPIPEVVSKKKFDTDFQIAYGDPLILPINTKQPPPRLWVFGRLDSVYNKSFPKQMATLNAKEIQNLETGSYTVITQFPGKNTIFEVGYTKTVTDIDTKEQLTSPWVSVKPINIFGLQPRMVLLEFRKMLAATDDTITEYRLEVTNPAIDIVSIDETYSEGKDVLDIRGYTNVAKGTVISFVMDKEIPSSDNTYITEVKEDSVGTWRYFQVLIPIDYETMPVGPHFISASSPQGATQTVPFYVYDLPAGQEVPNETVRYVAGDLFRPTPTPLVITVVQTVVQTQTIFVPVTPNDEQVYIAQKKASDENWSRWVTIGLSLLVVGCIAGFGGWYLIGVIKRARLR